VRRVVRRALTLARRLELPDGWWELGVARVADMLGSAYPELATQRATIVATIADEHARFERAVAAGLRALRAVTTLDGKVAFDLFQNHGIPFELTLELAHATGRSIDRDEFQRAFEQHRALSRTTSSGSFAGGLAEHSTEIVRYHTLTHLLHAALREVLGAHVVQRGSNITRERLRFDFSHDRKLSAEELGQVEQRVAAWLARDLRVERATMTEPEARALGAIGAFGEKYGETVSVFTIRDASSGDVVSREFCGGPHVQTGAELRGRFQIVREQAVSAGIRRIKAVLIPTG
jgi:alanyl-tRNA synthetase